MRRRLCTLSAGLLLLTLTGGCQQDQSAAIIHLSGRTMGTTWSVAMVPGPAGSGPAELQQRLQARLDRLNRLMSTYDPDSELSRFNNRASIDWFPLSEETAQVIALAQEVSRLTGGAFDVSVGPLVELWGFGATARGQGIPDQAEIREALALVGYEKIRLRRHPAAVSKRVPELRIDLAAVAKGYAVDALAELLVSQGISNFLVEIGGEIKVSGQRSAGSPWRVAIEKPLEETREVAAIFPLGATALATSGNYRNFYEANGHRYAHAIDPASGRPVRHRLASVTVLDRTCARADALATALMVLGEDQGRRFCENNQIAAYFLIQEEAAMTVYASPAFRRLVEDGAR